MRIALISNWHKQCGNAEYARALLNEIWKEFPDAITFTKPEEAHDVDVAIINWHPSRVEMSLSTIAQMKQKGMKVIIILQNSSQNGYYAAPADPCKGADAVVSHHDMPCNVPLTIIPHGIPIVNGLSVSDGSLTIGIAGFPYAWKRFDMTAKIAHELGGRSLLIAPTHDMGDVNGPINAVMSTYPTADVDRNWHTVEEVVRMLATCTMNIFWYQHMPPDDLAGQSGSVGLGVAARRPIIISDHPKLSSVAKYTDEIYVAKTEAEVMSLAKWILTGVDTKRPNRILEEMGWDKTGRMYCELIKKVAA